MSNIGSFRNAVVGQSAVTGPSLKVGNDTKIDDVRNFLRENEGQTKVYGHKDKTTGAVTLYVSDKKTSLFDRVTQRSATRREVAREEIGRLLGDLKASHDGKTLSDTIRKPLTAILDNVKNRIMAPESRALRSTDVLKYTAAARSVSNVVEERESAPEKATYDLDHVLSEAPGDGRTYADRPLTSLTKGRSTLEAPQISIGGKDYAPARYLASGGFGDVCAYRATDGSMLAVKLSKTPDDDSVGQTTADVHGDAAKEIAMHLKATESGDGNLLAMKGAFKLEDGRVGVALEFAPNGNVFDMGHAIIDAIATDPTQVGAGQITRDEADLIRLTMIKDMATGVQQLHDTGVTHFDFKSPNCLIDQHGTVKVADFGGSYVGSASPRSLQIDIDAAGWKAPELSQARSFTDKLTQEKNLGLGKFEPSAIEEFQAAAKKDVITHLKLVFPGQAESAYEGTAANLMSNRDANIADDLVKMSRIDSSVDVWGLGTSALDLFSKTGVNPDQKRDSIVEDDVRDWSENGLNRALGGRDASGALPSDVLAQSTGHGGIDDLINGLLLPDPDKRAAFFTDDFKGHPAMQLPGVGSPEARALVAAIASKDATVIASARSALAAAFP